MKKLTYCILLIACFSSFAKSNDSASISITGVTGKVLANVEKRLTELQQIKPLNELSEEELRYQMIKAIQPFGYFKADIIFQTLNPHEVSINIHPGPQMHISSVKIEIMGEGSQNQLLINTLKSAPIKVGDPLFTDQYNKIGRAHV